MPPRLQSRIVYAAAHVAGDHAGQIDWDDTLAIRRHLWACGLGVAEAMDTAQRGMGLSWPSAKELISRSAHEAKSAGGGIVCGAGTDQIPGDQTASLEQIAKAYEEQINFIQAEGGRVVLMASRALARTAGNAQDYGWVFDQILPQAAEPVILHWLGEAFDPTLRGYWGCANIDDAMESCLALIHKHAAKIDGIKLSLLDAEKEIEMRRRLPASVKMYTGDDFDYPRLILGDGTHYSHALLGIFDAIAPAAAAAIVALDAGDVTEYNRRLLPTVPLARHIFQAPTQFYKTGIAFLAYLNGRQKHFRMLGGQESARNAAHLSELFRLAQQAGVIEDPDRAAARMRQV